MLYYVTKSLLFVTFLKWSNFLFCFQIGSTDTDVKLVNSIHSIEHPQVNMGGTLQVTINILHKSVRLIIILYTNKQFEFLNHSGSIVQYYYI